MANFFKRLKEGLLKTREQLAGSLGALVSSHRLPDEDFFEELEAILLGADVGIKVTAALVAEVRDIVKREKISETERVIDLLRQAIVELLVPRESAGLRSAGGVPLNLESGRLSVILIVGVNGVGKTTTVGKLAAYLSTRGQKVMLAAADTFRAAAVEQLAIWSERARVPLIRHESGADAGAVVYDAMASARSRGIDVVVVDTAGRLHTRSNLMEELKKIKRIISRECPGAPQEVLLVLDATTGQNAIAQARLFQEAVGVTGIILAKLDGTAKGGVVLAIYQELGLPIKMVGIGEGVEDLQEFRPEEFSTALVSRPEGEERDGYPTLV